MLKRRYFNKSVQSNKGKLKLTSLQKMLAYADFNKQCY